MDVLCCSIQIIGLVIEIVGVTFMANSYVPVEKHSVIRVLFSGLFRGDLAKKVTHPAIFHSDDRIKGLQGLAFIGFGFLIQALGVLFSTYIKIFTI
jgi:hypothetical protein